MKRTKGFRQADYDEIETACRRIAGNAEFPDWCGRDAGTAGRSRQNDEALCGAIRAWEVDACISSGRWFSATATCNSPRGCAC
jgi:hypothetical protein